jgi:hypothetical protein
VLLKTLYGPKVGSRFTEELDEDDLLIPSGYPISAGTKLYLDNKTPLFTTDWTSQLKTVFELLISLGSILALAWKWFRSDQEEEFEYENTAIEKIISINNTKDT